MYSVSMFEVLGQFIRPDKKSALSSTSSTILNRWNMTASHWSKLSDSFGQRFLCAVGSVEQLQRYADNSNEKWVCS